MTSPNPLVLPPQLPLAHLFRLTDTVGMLEHCVFATPDRLEGYALDDNARALQVCLRLSHHVNSEILPKYQSIYLQFLLSARTQTGFHQDLNADFSWKDDAAVTEGYGRAMVALAETGMSGATDDLKLAAIFVFDQQLPLLKKVTGLRAMAQMIAALYFRRQFETASPDLLSLLKMRKQLKNDMAVELPVDLKEEVVKLADNLVTAYQRQADGTWQWFEEVLSYDNGRLPMGLFAAYQVTQNQTYREIALTALDFLIAQTWDQTKNCFSFPGYRGWFPKGQTKALFGQQPIEAGSTVEACMLAYEITKQDKYFNWAKQALNWYLGQNISQLNLLDLETGGVRDGLESWGCNPNEGAESILSFALAYEAVQKAAA